MKKIRNFLLVVLLVLCLALQVSAAEVVETGSCGKNATYTLYDDGLLVIEGEGAVHSDFFCNRNDITHLEIRDGIAELSARAFAGCTSLEEIVIADSVTSIGDYALSGCTNLSKVTLGKGITVIGSEMFYTNENLSEIILPEGLTTIEANAFFGTKLKAVEIPSTVTTIGQGAFSFIEELESIKLSKNLKDIPYEMCRGCTNLKEVTIPEGVESIGISAFENCSSLEEIVIPDSVTSLNGNAAWSDEEGDRSAIGAFSGCTNLKSITLGKGCEWIPWGFLGSDALETLIIPEGVTIIDNYAFCFCPSLTYVEIPASVEYIGGFAFVDNFSMTTIVFKGDPPDKMDGMMGICGNYITAAFYPKDVPGWENANIGTAAMIPYTLDADGNIIPEAPEQSEVLAAMEQFRSGEYFDYFRDLSAGKAYPNNYRYYINGNFHEGKGSEAFAFELSDACFGFLPISDHRDVVYADLQVGDLLYMNDQVWVIGEINAEGVKVHGAENEVIVYDRSLTKAQVETADSYRTRYGVSPSPGVVNPDTKLEPDPVGGVPSEATVFRRILALKETHPDGMSWTEKNMYYCNVQALISEGLATNPAGHGCSAFGYLASDTAFGDLPARYITSDKLDYDSIMVGDNLMGYNHQVVVLKVYKDCLIVAEGNYDKMMHWGRIMTREEVEDGYDLFTRYPEGTVAPERGNYDASEDLWEVPPMENPFEDITEDMFCYDAVLWAVDEGITKGKTETTFLPSGDCTRAQVVTFLWRAAGEPEPKNADISFPDVAEGKYYTKAVAWAVENGITNGFKDGSFGPDKTCTRGQIVTFLWRYAEEPEIETAGNPFPDLDVTSYCGEAVLWAVENGITNGYKNGTFGPNKTCTRDQIVTFLYRYLVK